MTSPRPAGVTRVQRITWSASGSPEATPWRKLAPPLACAWAAGAVPVLDPANGHYYEHIDAGLSWTAARAAALASDFGGRQGYLATVTSADENAFLLSLGPYGWLGGSDAAVTDEWRWVDGPE